MHDLQVGDVVTLKCGSQKLVVSEIIETLTQPGMVRVIWFPRSLVTSEENHVTSFFPGEDLKSALVPKGTLTKHLVL